MWMKHTDSNTFYNHRLGILSRAIEKLLKHVIRPQRIWSRHAPTQQHHMPEASPQQAHGSPDLGSVVFPMPKLVGLHIRGPNIDTIR